MLVGEFTACQQFYLPKARQKSDWDEPTNKIGLLEEIQEEIQNLTFWLLANWSISWARILSSAFG